MSGLTVLDVKRKPDRWCLECGLYKKCESPIMNGEGAEDPIWLFVGEAPGKDEDKYGTPFVGETGHLLRETIESVGININKCRFTNAVRCRPPDNKLTAFPHALDLCRVHILREIRATRPKVVVILGATALQSLLGRSGILKLHGEVIDAGLWKYVISFHPAYLLRNNTPAVRKQFFNAIKLVKRMGQPERFKKAHKREHVIITDRKMLYEYHDHLKKQKYLFEDIEGSTLSPFAKGRKLEVGIVGFAWDKNSAVGFPVQGRVGYEDKIKVEPEEMLEVVQDIAEDPDIKHVGHFFKYDYTYMGVLHNIWFGGQKAQTGYHADTGLMSYAINEEKGGHSLKDWAWRLGMGSYDHEKRQYCLVNPSVDPERGGNLIYMPLRILAPYNLDDCIATCRLFWKLKRQLEADRLWDMPFLFPLMWHQWTAAQMEINGLRIDPKRNVELNGIYNKRLDKLDDRLVQFNEVKKLARWHRQKVLKKIIERVQNYKRPVPDERKKVFELFNRAKNLELNLKSTDNRRKLVFDFLGYEPIYETKTGLPSVEREVLEQLQENRPTKVLGTIIKRGELASAQDKYIKPVLGWMGTDDRTHTFYKPQGTTTGRVSSEKPNHENLPKRNQLAMELRTQFVSSGDKYRILEMDKKQIEMRLYADRANDDIMIEEFNAGKDPHRMGASAAFEVPEEEVTKEQRTDAKSAVSFGILYGRQAAALAADFGWSLKKGQAFIDRYFGKYDDCLAYRLQREKYILKHGVVYSHFFRRRHCIGFDSEDDAMQAQAVREGINSPIQGDASDITWVAGHRLAKWLMKYRMRSKVIVAVHDALYVDTYIKELQDVLVKLNEFMADRKFIEKWTGWYCQVPIPNDAFIGPNLGKMTELEHKSEMEFILPKAA